MLTFVASTTIHFDMVKRSLFSGFIEGPDPGAGNNFHELWTWANNLKRQSSMVSELTIEIKPEDFQPAHSRFVFSATSKNLTEPPPVIFLMNPKTGDAKRFSGKQAQFDIDNQGILGWTFVMDEAPEIGLTITNY